MKINSENERQLQRQGQITEGDQISRRIPKLLSEREIEALYGFCVRTLQRWRVTGEGPCFTRANRLILYAIRDIEDFVSEREHPSTPENALQARNRSCETASIEGACAKRKARRHAASNDFAVTDTLDSSYSAVRKEYQE